MKWWICRIPKIPKSPWVLFYFLFLSKSESQDKLGGKKATISTSIHGDLQGPQYGLCRALSTKVWSPNATGLFQSVAVWDPQWAADLTDFKKKDRFPGDLHSW